MKIKLIISAFVIVLAITFYSFKNIGEKESSNVAIVMAFRSKEYSDGYKIMYGDGSEETVPIKLNYPSVENALENAAVAAKIMNLLHEKGYRYSGIGHPANTQGMYNFPFMVFEKK